jgi:hypothetical protein
LKILGGEDFAGNSVVPPQEMILPILYFILNGFINKAKIHREKMKRGTKNEQFHLINRRC